MLARVKGTFEPKLASVKIINAHTYFGPAIPQL